MFKKQRNRDFCRRCIEIYDAMKEEGKTPEIKEVVCRALRTPAPCYYFDSHYAYVKLLKLRRNGLDSLPDTPAGRMWRELAWKVDGELLRHPGGVLNAVTYVLNFGHPSFFPISMTQAMRVARNAFIFRVRYEHRPRRDRKPLAV